MGALDQFRLLLWKNYLLQKRRPVATVFELLIPVLFSILLVFIRTEVSVTRYDNITTWREFTVDKLPPFYPGVVPTSGVWTVAYAPNNSKTLDQIMEAAESLLNRVHAENELSDTGKLLEMDSYSEIAKKCANDFSLFSSVGANDSNSSDSATSVYQRIPLPPRSVLDDLAAAANQTSIEFLADVIKNDSVGEITTQIEERLKPKVKECIDSQMSQPQGAGSNMTLNANNAIRNQSARTRFGKSPKVKLLSFATEEDFMTYAKNDTNMDQLLAGVIFRGDFNDSFPDDATLTLRFRSNPVNVNPADQSAFSGYTNTWRTHMRFPVFQRSIPRNPSSPFGDRPNYYGEGFLSVQHAIYRGINFVLSGSNRRNDSFALKRYPFPPYINDDFIIAIQRTLPLLIMLSFFYTALVIVRSVVQEKESRMKEYMMMMGLSNWLHWLAWFIKYLIFLCISCIIMTIFYKIQTSLGSVLTYSDGSLMFVFLLLFSIATINFCFLLSTLFSKANVAAAAGGVLYGMTYIPYLFLSNSYDQLSFGVKLLSCLVSNVAMGIGCQIIGMFEGKGSGVQWRTLNKGVTVDDSFSLLMVFVMLIVDSILYMLLALYIEGVRPGEYGLPKPWYFPFTKSYWFGVPHRNDIPQPSSGHDIEGQVNEAFETEAINDSRDGAPSDYIEEEPKSLRKVVEIKNLTKVFKTNSKSKTAVDDLSMNMYEGQINVLLGHNGAGKTTTMSMLTGFFPPTSGEATVMGHSILTEMSGVRQSLGLCPQFNILFDLLTVDEHLYFFGRLKGLSKKEATDSAKTMRNDLLLRDKADAQSNTLSGGMKRKLSVGIALSAGSKYVILDEPTSGMDPSARRAIWDVIQHYRSRCSMLLSTHFMDEADLLGDRITIMAKGKVRCAGSSVFLKSKFGVGYHVILTKTPQCNMVELKNLFHSHVKEAKLERMAGGEVAFQLPFDGASSFPELFRALEDQATELGITDFGATVTTIEEVFLSVTADAETAVSSVSRRISDRRMTLLSAHANLTSDNTNDPSQPLHQADDERYLHSSLKLNAGLILWFQQFYALFIKRLLHSRRNYKVAIAQVLVPVFFGIFAVLNAKYPPFERGNVPLDLGMDPYGPNTVYYEKLASSAFVNDLSSAYSRQFAGSEVTAIDDTKGDLEKLLADKYAAEGGDFNSANLISAMFNTNATSSHSVAWFNGQAFHTAASSLAYLDQAYVRLVANRPDLSVKLINYPLPRNSTNRIQEQLIGSLSGFLIAFNIVLGFSFLAASFCLFLVRERVDRSSLLQALSGVDPVCFWLSAFLWDFINFIAPCILTLVMFAAFSVTEFTAHWAVVLLIFALYCWASLPLMYLLSFLFSVPSTALVRITIVNIITGLASIITMNVLRLLAMATPSLNDVADALDWVFLLMPQYCLGQGLSDIYTNHKMVNICTSSEFFEMICQEKNITYQVDFLAWPEYGAGRFATFLAAQGAIFFAILFLLEFHYFALIWRLMMPIRRAFSRMTHAVRFQNTRSERLYVDEDVQAEKDRINHTLLPDLVTTDRLVIKQLRKVYGSGRKALVAVDSLSLGIPEGECFGLLGINGAGKTTTFKMLSGDYKSSSGTAYLDGYDVTKQLRKVQQRLGYCPQFDGLIEQMTGAETVRMFARLRGVPENEIPECVTNLSKILHFAEHIDKPCGTYSGGNKRKLSTAIALVGNPPVVLLDEPSTGMDPGARRMLWDALTNVRASGCSIVITSHSMEECEALCTRLAIMVNGELRCLGGPQHLKARFGQGYTVEIKSAVSGEGSAEIRAYMEESFPGASLKDDNLGLMHFHLPQGDVPIPLSEVFKLMENGKATLDIIGYTVSQTTLEQVFLSLVKFQRESLA